MPRRRRGGRRLSACSPAADARRNARLRTRADVDRGVRACRDADARRAPRERSHGSPAPPVPCRSDGPAAASPRCCPVARRSGKPGRSTAPDGAGERRAARRTPGSPLRRAPGGGPPRALGFRVGRSGAAPRDAARQRRWRRKSGAARLLVRDAGEQVCVGIDRLDLDGGDCLSPRFNSHSDRGGLYIDPERGIVAGVYPAQVTAANLRFRGGGKVRVAANLGLGYTGHYRGAVHFLIASIPPGKTIIGATLLDASGRAIGEATADGPGRDLTLLERPSTVLSVGSGRAAVRLVVGAKVGALFAEPLACLGIELGRERGQCDDELDLLDFNRVNARVSCERRRTIVFGMARRAIQTGRAHPVGRAPGPPTARQVSPRQHVERLSRGLPQPRRGHPGALPRATPVQRHRHGCAAGARTGPAMRLRGERRAVVSARRLVHAALLVAAVCCWRP